ncbi:uncharacterized protein LOC135471674 [Liolophura sinensis]|uniref:uncharacterized protein LOC135471674 n=1 Tax=Liolophura sinensis TaxID=3198878 RepID=UPI003158BF1B
MDEENCAQKNCSASVLCNSPGNCTDKHIRQNCSTLSLDDIQLSYAERAGLLGAFTFCLLVLVLICVACCCKCCCCSCCMDPKHPKPVSSLQSQSRPEEDSSEILQLRTRDGYVDPVAICSDHVGRQLQPSSVLLPLADYRGVPPTSPTTHLPPVRFHGPYFDPELPTYESLFPDGQHVTVERNSAVEKK